MGSVRASGDPKPITEKNTQYSFIGTGAVTIRCYSSRPKQQAKDGEERNLSRGQRSERSACIYRAIRGDGGMMDSLTTFLSPVN